MSKSNGQTLLEKAKAVAIVVQPTRSQETERLDLAIAFARREVTASQSAKAMNQKHSNIYQLLGRSLLSACRRGVLEIVDKRK